MIQREIPVCNPASGAIGTYGQNFKGAIGGVLVACLLPSMPCCGYRLGIVNLCIGGGQGIALTVERL